MKAALAETNCFSQFVNFISPYQLGTTPSLFGKEGPALLFLLVSFSLQHQPVNSTERETVHEYI